MTAETEIANILDKARWEIIEIRDQFAESRYTEIYDEYDNILFDLILELEPNFFDKSYRQKRIKRDYAT